MSTKQQQKFEREINFLINTTFCQKQKSMQLQNLVK